MTTEEIQKELNEMSLASNFFEVLLYTTNLNLTFNSNSFGLRDVYQTLNENEISYLFGWYLKNRDKAEKKILDKRYASNRLMILMNNYHENYLPKLGELTNSENFYEAIRQSEHNIQETIFYSGSGAYDYQYVDFAVDKYRNDSDWLWKNKRFQVDSAKRFFYYIKSLMHFKLNDKQRKFSINELYSFKLDNYIFKQNPDFIEVVKAFSIKEGETLNTNFENIFDFNEIKIRPIIKKGDVYYLPMSYHLSEAIYDSPFYWMLSDNEYRSKALKNRGDAAEYIVSKILRRKIPLDIILSGIELKINKRTTITDLDICIVKGDKMIILQIKSKRLREISKRGNSETFEEDFKKAIVDANGQAEIAYDPILNNQAYLLNQSTGEKRDISKINEIYHGCVLLDGYSSLTSHTRMFFHDKEVIPIAITIFDLDVIVRYLNGFGDLFDYFKKRTIQSKNCFATSELSFFAMYLTNKLEFKNTETKGKPENKEMFYIDNSYAQKFDGEYYIELTMDNKNFLHKIAKNINRNDKCFCGSGKKLKSCCKEIKTIY